MSHTNDIQVIAAHDNMCVVNNALLVDLTGQINGETIGPEIYSGTGGALRLRRRRAAREGRALA